MEIANRLRHSGWVGVVLPLILAIGSTFTASVFRALLLVAAVVAATWTFHNTEYAERKIGKTLGGAVVFIFIAVGIFIVGLAHDSRSTSAKAHKEANNDKTASLPDTPSPADSRLQEPARPAGLPNIGIVGASGKTTIVNSQVVGSDVGIDLRPSKQATVKGTQVIAPNAINQGPGSIAQIGGTGNQATVNNLGPSPPSFVLTTLRENVKVSDNRYQTDFRLVVQSDGTIPYLYLRAEAPTITSTISFVPEGVESFTTSKRNGRGGVGFFGTNVEGVPAGSYIISTFSTQPDKITLTYDPQFHN